MTSRRPYRPQDIGDLRERVALQRFETIETDMGGVIEEWVTQAIVFARIEPIKSTEEVIGAGIRATEAVLVHIRHREDVATDWRNTDPALRSRKAELSQMSPECIDELGPLPN